MKTYNFGTIPVITAREWAKQSDDKVVKEAVEMMGPGIYVKDGGLWRQFDSRSDNLSNMEALYVEARAYFHGEKVKNA